MMNMSDSIQRQLDDARENLRIIKEQQAKFVVTAEMPIQWLKEERQWLGRITELEQQLAEQTVSGGPGPRRDSMGSTPGQLPKAPCRPSLILILAAILLLILGVFCGLPLLTGNLPREPLSPIPSTTLTEIPSSTSATKPAESPSPRPVATLTEAPLSTPTTEPAGSPCVVPTAMPTVIPSPTPTTGPTEPPPPTSAPTPAKVFSAPAPAPAPLHLLRPERGKKVERTNRVEFEWEGNLRWNQAFQVSVRHIDTGTVFSSPGLDTHTWAIDLPPERWGTYHWQVIVVQNDVTVASSEEWHFYFDPVPHTPQPHPPDPWQSP